MDNPTRNHYMALGYNDDLLPTLPEEKTWNFTHYATIWMGSVHNIPNYLAVGALFALGLSVSQVFLAIMSAAMLLSVMMVLNGMASARYGIPFSMLLRATFGHKGATVIGVLRGVIASIFWFGFQTFAGSQALEILISKIIPSFSSLGGNFTVFSLTIPSIICFALFWCINIVFIIRGMDLLRGFSNYLFILVYVVFSGMAIWAIQLAGGVQPIIHFTTSTPLVGNASLVFLGGVTAIISSWAAPIVSVADFTRNASSVKQIIGQPVGLIITYLLFAITSISIIVGSEIALGTPIWNILDVIKYFNHPAAIVLTVFTLCLTTLSVNVTGNIIPAGYQMAALFPKRLTFTSGAMIVAVIGVLIMPWKLMENSTSIFILLNTIGALLGPVAGVMVADYFLSAKKHISLDDLYANRGKYVYFHGVNVQAIGTIIISSIIGLSGQWIQAFAPFSNMAWMIGTFSAFIMYLLVQKITNKKHTHMRAT